MVLYTKCILKEAKESDGVRISVMSRHTLDDGKTLDKRITSDKFDHHFKNLAPPPKLVGMYKRNEISWEEFGREYKRYISTYEVSEDIRLLSQRAINHDITILCIEHKPEKCHRRLLAEECKKYQPSLKVVHR